MPSPKETTRRSVCHMTNVAPFYSRISIEIVLVKESNSSRTEGLDVTI